MAGARSAAAPSGAQRCATAPLDVSARAMLGGRNAGPERTLSAARASPRPPAEAPPPLPSRGATSVYPDGLKKRPLCAISIVSTASSVFDASKSGPSHLHGQPS